MKVRQFARPVEERNSDFDLPLMSVSKTRGVVRRDEISDKPARADSLENYRVCSEGDLVINRMSAYSGALGIARERGLVSPDYLILRLNSAMTSEFAGHLFKSHWMVSEMASLVKGIGSVESGSARTPRLNWSDLALINVSVPPRAEQDAIVEFLDREIAQIETLAMKQQQLVSLLDERAETLLEKFISGASGATKKRLKHIANIKNGYSFDASQFDSQGRTPVVRQSDFFADELTVFTDEETPNSALIQNGEILVSLSGDFNCVMWSGGQAGLNQRCASIKSKHEGIDSDWLKFAVELGLRDITNENVSTTVSNMSSYELKNMKVSVPSTERQREIAVNLSSELNEIRELQLASGKLLSLLSDRRESLIFAAVIGQLDLGGL